MDWSLVLTSQDIASTLLQHPEHGHWMLLVEPQDYDRAIAAIRQYRLENQRWSWRREIVQTGILFHWGAVVWVGLLLLVYLWDVCSGSLLKSLGMLDSNLVHKGEWWRLFTAMTLHGDIAHLAMNSAMILLFGGLAMARFGFGSSLWAAYLAGLLGNLAGLWFDPETHRSLGASGIVMGTLGLVAVQSIFLLRRGFQAAKYVISGFMAGVMLFVLFGMDPRSDVLAHAGGFLGGAVLGTLLSLLPKAWTENARTDVLGFALWAAWISLTWLLAVRQVG
jgi:membrane associated rhomboid family serine protease